MKPAEYLHAAAAFLEAREQHARLFEAASLNAQGVGGADPVRVIDNIGRCERQMTELRGRMAELAERLGGGTLDLETLPAKLPSPRGTREIADAATTVQFRQLAALDARVASETEALAAAIMAETTDLAARLGAEIGGDG